MLTQDFQIARQIFSLFRRLGITPAYLLIPVLFSLGGAVFEGVGFGLLIPLLQGFLERDFSFLKSMPGISTVVNMLPVSITGTDRWLFAFLIGVFVAAMLLKNILKYAAMVSMSYISERSMHRLRKTLFTRYLSFGKLYFDHSSVGHHGAVLSEFATQALTPFLVIDKYINAFFSLIVAVIVMTIISWKLTLFAIPLLCLLHFAIRRLIRVMYSLSQSIARSASGLGKTAIDILSAVPLVIASNMQRDERERYAAISDERARLEFRRQATEKSISPFQEVLTLFAILVLFSGMLYLLVRDGGSLAPSFLVYFYLVPQAAAKFSTVTNYRGALANASGAVHEVFKVLSDEDKYFVPSGSRTFSVLQHAIEFRNLTFNFPGREHVLDQFSLTIEKDCMTAIVGPTGAGKTTIINLLLRFYDCPAGTIFLDGTDIREYNVDSLRRHMALVSQDTQLLHESLRRNIAYGVSGISNDDICRAVDRARLSAFVDMLPQGLDTVIGDRGVKLSGGERQRVSIARALLKGAEILILDEATSSLDSQTEQLIQEAVDDAIRGRTAIVIAHRLSTVRHAHHIIVIDQGSCVERGTIEELLAKKGSFHRMWEAQKFT